MKADKKALMRAATLAEKWDLHWVDGLARYWAVYSEGLTVETTAGSLVGQMVELTADMTAVMKVEQMVGMMADLKG